MQMRGHMRLDESRYRNKLEQQVRAPVCLPRAGMSRPRAPRLRCPPFSVEYVMQGRWGVVFFVQIQEIDDIFEDELDEREGIELTAADVAQLQQLERELSKPGGVCRIQSASAHARGPACWMVAWRAMVEGAFNRVSACIPHDAQLCIRARA
ncbi:hypothetical protein EON67_08175 [archaeon]|nr:MAG: hypothetical protein EON67_08175 [archaeon]